MSERRIIAEFVPQAWINDCAVQVDPEGPTTFDVTDEVVAMGESVAITLRDDQHETDTLRFAAAAPDWIREWHGPFYIRIQDAIAEFYGAH